MSDFKNPASKILWQFLGVLDRLYGMYSDANTGFDLFSKKIAEASTPQTRQAQMFFGADDPNKPDAHYVHSAKTQDVIDRNSKDNENARLLALACIVFVYSVWETEIRPKYADALGIEPHDIKSDLFGDLRHYRHAILHNNGILDKETPTLKYVNVGEAISLSEENMKELFGKMFDELNSLSLTHTGDAFNLRFERRLNPAKPEQKN